jgi:hypothetical protein
MPQAIKLTDAEGCCCIYAPITQNGKVVDSFRYMFDPEENDDALLRIGLEGGDWFEHARPQARFAQGHDRTCRQ